jgi:hypothetical protein
MKFTEGAPSFHGQGNMSGAPRILERLKNRKPSATHLDQASKSTESPDWTEEPEYECSMSCSGRNNFGPISRLFDELFLKPTYCCFLRSLLQWRPYHAADDSSTCVHSEQYVRDLASDSVIPPCLVNAFIIISILLMKWSSWNHENVVNLKDSLRDTQSNVALVSALIFSVLMSFS